MHRSAYKAACLLTPLFCSFPILVSNLFELGHLMHQDLLEMWSKAEKTVSTHHSTHAKENGMPIAHH